MIKQLAVVLAIIATAHAFGAWKGGLKVRFDLNPLGIGRSHFLNMPRTVAEAKNSRWVLTPRPDGPMPSLVMYCPSLRDRTLPEDQFKDNIFDWEVQGFTKWSPPPSTLGVQTHYWTIQQYFISEAYLAVSPADRIAERDPDKTIQFENVWVTGFNKQLMAISTDASIIADTARSGFTKQACIPMMGRHYYYNMTATTPCTAESLLPWFPLVHDGLIGMGFIVFGKLPEKSLVKNYFERPATSDVKLIVPNGPQCLYNLADHPALVTMHAYYINSPWLVNCIGQ